MTVVTGLAAAGLDVAALGKELRASCGTGGTTHEDTIELQGDHRDKVEAALLHRGLKSKRAGG
jgi:translation initiation factor 1